MSRRPSLTLLLSATMLLAVCPSIQGADCTYRKDSLGNTRYQCDDGKSGTLREDSLGAVRDSESGTSWRKDSLGNVRGSDGTSYRKDSLGNVRSNNGVTWRTDSLGNLRASDGTLCRTNSLGNVRCDGHSTPPAVLQGN